jgi:hypothetical protein
MPKIARRYLAVCIAFVVSLSTLYAQSAKITTDKDLDWSQHTSFDVSAGDLVTVTKREIDKSKVLQEVQSTIIEQMENKGYTYSPGRAELMVTFTAEVIESVDSGDLGPLGQQPADEPINIDQSRTWSQERKEGSLAIDIALAESRKSVWRSNLAMDYSGNDLMIALNAAAGKSLRKLPGVKK